jgi:hypothetical protein
MFNRLPPSVSDCYVSRLLSFILLHAIDYHRFVVVLF